MGTAVSAGLESFEANFLNKVALEIRYFKYLHLCRFSDPIMSELCQLKGIKDVTEITHITANNIEEAISEVARAMGASKAQLGLLASKLDSGLSGSSHDILGQIRTTLSANTALLSEVLKVIVVFNTCI